jgi:hypothetical protein
VEEEARAALLWPMSQLILPDDDLPPDLTVFARSIRAFAEQALLPHARLIDEQRRFRKEMVADLAAAGILGGPLAKTHGGQAWTPLQLALAHEEIGAVCNNARGFLAVHSSLVGQCLERFGSGPQQARWLPALCAGKAIGCFCLTEEEAGSDVASLRCRAEPAGGGWRLFGKKIWTTNGGVADVALVFATVDPERGRDGITAFVVPTDRPGLRREPMPGVELGHRGSDHAQMVFDGLEVLPDEVVGAAGEGLAVAFGALAFGRLSVASGAVGMHRAALRASLEFTAARRQFGRPLAAFQMVQERLADMAVELLAARGLVHRVARRRAQGSEVPADLAAAKLYATEAAARAADAAVVLHGGRGYSSAYPVERLLRDVMGLRIYEGTSLIQKTILARALSPG